MSIVLDKDTWIWAIIQNPEKKSSFLGQHDTTNDIKFIPAFLDKESALMCINQFAKDESLTYEPQALFYDDLLSYAVDNNFIIYILDNKGIILDKIVP